MTETKDSKISNDNLALWNTVAQTNPQHTKNFAGSDGFNGTGINPTYNIMRATEAFGPMGIGWGVDIVSEDWVKGAPLGFDIDGNMWGTVVVHVMRVNLWYMLGDKKGIVTGFGETTFVGKGENGRIFTDEDAPKKSLTDATGKCLALLGFSADVYMGLYDDHKYVEAMTERFRNKGDPATPALTQNRPGAAPKQAVVSTAPAASAASNASAAPATPTAAQPAGGDPSDPEAWIARVGTMRDDGELDHARKEVAKYIKGEDLKRVRKFVDERQLAVWFERIPLLSRNALAQIRAKADKNFSGDNLARVIAAIEAREAAFAAMKPAGTAVAA
ncbi:hypothetical protein [Ottowia sp.]|uniref:hypothetical protein n=1 Tax=Ottowia sp. TaxID=1898956 RepID=UPI0025DA3A18|nr:hypothetical protein [Ottowia sp.]MBK6616119.1 hypothetical protein [Ottowia sp.]